MIKGAPSVLFDGKVVTTSPCFRHFFGTRTRAYNRVCSAGGRARDIVTQESRITYFGSSRAGFSAFDDSLAHLVSV